VIYKGEGENGKSVLMDLKAKLFGAKNVTYTMTDKLFRQEYLASLAGKLVNFVPEVPVNSWKNAAVLKAYLSGNCMYSNGMDAHFP
jgi:phage/plasmid-associated DNA primase